MARTLRVERGWEGAQAQCSGPVHAVNKGEGPRAPAPSLKFSDTPPFSTWYTGIEAKEEPSCLRARLKPVRSGHVNVGQSYRSAGRDSEVLGKKRKEKGERTCTSQEALRDLS